MGISRFYVLVIFCAVFTLFAGCVSEQDYKDLRIQNETQRKRLEELGSEFKVCRLKLEKTKRQLDTAKQLGGTDLDALKQKVAALEEDLAKKRSLIASMQQHLLGGGVAIPVELSTMLEDFAKKEGMVTYDSSRAIVKFKSDLLFEPGSDKVAPIAAEAIKSLCKILNSEEAKNFDIIIAGHTDDMRIGKPATRVKHPTNWHLSSHRAISVMNVMAGSDVVPERMSVRGFGEYRPLEANKPNKKGNPKNRRVEIYIVAKGT